jgi:NAD+ kinase
VCGEGVLETSDMAGSFATIGLVGRRGNRQVADSVVAVEAFLSKRGVAIVVEDNTSQLLGESGHNTMPRADLGECCDLIVVVGGDGSLLGVARDLAHAGVPVVGVNRGGLGFLADIMPDRIEAELNAVLNGAYSIEEHFLLDARVLRKGEEIARSPALNDVVVHPGSMARMMEFSLRVNDEHVYVQRSDGMIVASPTGSTAYALSAGGPIMHPTLDAIVVVPMFPHTLTSRPLVVPGDSIISVMIGPGRSTTPQASYDSQVNTQLQQGDEVRISKYHTPLKLLNTLGHSFYESCRSKLDWASRLGSG